LVFPSVPARAVSWVLQRLKVEGVTHGFRSSFRDWAGNETHFPREVAEAALAHVSGDATERAYHRSDALEKRRLLMEAWAGFVEGQRTGNVVQLRG
jgi:integrase